MDVFFTAELIARFAVCETVFTKPKSAQGTWRLSATKTRRAFFADPLNYSDLVSLFPFFLRVFANEVYLDMRDGGAVTFVKMVKLLRAFKITRSYTATEVMVQTVKRTAAPLASPSGVRLQLRGGFATGPERERERERRERGPPVESLKPSLSLFFAPSFLRKEERHDPFTKSTRVTCVQKLVCVGPKRE